MLKTCIILLTPFIISIVDIINGVLLYLQYFCEVKVDYRLYQAMTHTTGSSILLMVYVIYRSTHMCKYYKSACWMILIMHIISIIYHYTPISLINYLYIVWVISAMALVVSTISILGYKTYKTINSACKRSETE